MVFSLMLSLACAASLPLLMPPGLSGNPFIIKAAYYIMFTTAMAIEYLYLVPQLNIFLQS